MELPSVKFVDQEDFSNYYFVSLLARFIFIIKLLWDYKWKEQKCSLNFIIIDLAKG